MAAIVFKNRKMKIVSPYQGEKLWRIMHGEEEANPNELKYCQMIEAVYLNPNNPSTPKSYIQRHKHLFADTSPVPHVVAETFFPTRKDLD